MSTLSRGLHLTNVRFSENYYCLCLNRVNFKGRFYNHFLTVQRYSFLFIFANYFHVFFTIKKCVRTQL